MKLLKKAAMFGLDARIALAIFGALSVISGASLYSAIQEAKVTAIIVELKEVEKAIAQYLLDTGENIVVSDTSIFTVNAHSLIENTENLTSWNGPYLNYEKDDVSSWALNHSQYSSIVIRKYTKNAWTPNRECVAQSDCYYVVSVNHVDKSIANKVEERIDGADNVSTVDGSSRIITAGVSGQPDLRNIYLYTDINYR